MYSVSNICCLIRLDGATTNNRNSFKTGSATQREKRVGVPFAIQRLYDEPIQYTAASNVCFAVCFV